MPELAPSAATLLALLAGYGAILLAPGPNTFAIAGLAALEGHRAARPLCLGIGCGAGLCAGAGLVLAGAPQHPATATAMQLGAVLLLVRCGWRMLAKATRSGRPSDANGARWWAGFAIGLCNPMTFAYFIAAGTARMPSAVLVASILAVVVLASLRSLLIAAVLGNDSARARLLAWDRPLRLAFALALFGFALGAAEPLFRDAGLS